MVKSKQENEMTKAEELIDKWEKACTDLNVSADLACDTLEFLRTLEDNENVLKQIQQGKKFTNENKDVVYWFECKHLHLEFPEKDHIDGINYYGLILKDLLTDNVQPYQLKGGWWMCEQSDLENPSLRCEKPFYRVGKDWFTSNRSHKPFTDANVKALWYIENPRK